MPDRLLVRRDNMNCNIKSLYICVKDMDRAIAFYEAFLSRRLQKKMIYTVFLMSMDFDSEGNHIEITAPA